MVDPLAQVGEAIAALGRGDAAAARSSIAAAVAADRSLDGVADAIDVAASRLEAGDDLDPAVWNALGDACPSDLRALVEAHRG